LSAYVIEYVVVMIVCDVGIVRYSPNHCLTAYTPVCCFKSGSAY